MIILHEDVLVPAFKPEDTCTPYFAVVVIYTCKIIIRFTTWSYLAGFKTKIMSSMRSKDSIANITCICQTIWTPWCNRLMERRTDRHTHTERLTDRQINRHTHTHTHIHTLSDRQTDRETDRHTHTDWLTHRLRDRHTVKQYHTI